MIEVGDTSLKDVLIFKPKVHADDRGYFSEIYNARDFNDAGLSEVFVQDNLALSNRWVLRGLHYQVERPQGKLVYAVSGEIYDVAVDLRKGSPTFSEWMGVHLNADHRELLWIPPGFAHGYLILSGTATVAYKVTEYFAPDLERIILWNDPHLGIDWPLMSGQSPILSKKDYLGKSFHEAEQFRYPL